MKYLLDTNTCIGILRRVQEVTARFLSRKRVDVGVSVVTEGELRTGAAKSSTPMRSLKAVENFLQPLQILPFTTEDSLAYARIRAELEQAGKPIGALDTLIAAHAVSRELILVTSNEREFSRVSGAHIENWRIP